MTKYSLALLLAFSWATGCQKSGLPPSAPDAPVFSVTYKIEGTPDKILTAGQDGIYHFTRFRHDPTDDVLTFSGAFADASCPVADCPGALTFEFRNLETGQDFFSESLREGDWPFGSKKSGGQTSFLTTFYADGNGGNAPEYAWRVGQEADFQGEAFSHTFLSPVSVPVKLTARDASGITSSYEKIAEIGPSPGICPNARIVAMYDSLQNFFTLTAQTDVPGTFSTFHWNTGEDTQSIKVTDSLPHAVTVTMLGGCTVAASVGDLPSNLNFPFQTPTFNYEIQQTNVPGDSLQLGTVAVQWIDAQGVAWRSDFQPQIAGANFNVTELEDYEPNERDEKTVKMKITFQCQVFSPAGEAKTIAGEGVIAVARP